MRYLLYSILALALVGGALAATQTTSAPESQTTGETSQEKKTPKDYEEEMEDFVPSEKVPADSAISFPVDI
jgi:hypothetical protein